MKPAAPVMTTRLGMVTSGWWLGLVRVLMEEALDDREPHDLQIEPHRPVLDVVQVVLNPLLERRVATPAVHLRPAGQPRLHLVPQHVLRNAVLELLDEVRPLGPRA